MTYEYFDVRPKNERMPAHPALTHSQVRAVVSSHIEKLKSEPHFSDVYLQNMGCDWEDYEDQAKRFWCAALLKDQSYSGRPIPKYQAVAEMICADDIAYWLKLFENAIEECVLEPAQAATKMVVAEVVDCFYEAMRGAGFSEISQA